MNKLHIKFTSSGDTYTYSKWKLNVPLWGWKQTWQRENTTSCNLAEISILFSIHVVYIFFYERLQKKKFPERFSCRLKSVITLIFIILLPALKYVKHKHLVKLIYILFKKVGLILWFKIAKSNSCRKNSTF